MNQIDDSKVGSYEPLPKADYPLALVSWDKKPTANGLGLNLKFVVLEGANFDRSFYHFYNVQHTNPETVEISGQQIKNLVRACGLDADADLTSDLLDTMIGHRFIGTVGIAKAKPDSGYDDGNKLMKAYMESVYIAGVQDGTIKPVIASASKAATSATPTPPSAAQAATAPPAAAVQAAAVPAPPPMANTATPDAPANTTPPPPTTT